MKNKGFTLVELLAVLVLLAVLALIVIQQIRNVIIYAKSAADLRSAAAYVSAAKNYFAEPQGGDKTTASTHMLHELQVAGPKATSGVVQSDSEGVISMAMVLNEKCYVRINNESITVSDDTENCSLGDIVPSLSCFTYEEITAHGDYGVKQGDIKITGYSCGDKMSKLDGGNNYSHSSVGVGVRHNLYNTSGQNANLAIPSTINGKTVTVIGDAFSEDKGGYIGIKTVTIPSTVKVVSANAFKGNELTAVTFEKQENIKYIGASAFEKNSIKAIVIPTSLTTIESNTFAFNEIAEISIPSSVTSIGDSAFEWDNLTNLTIPSTIIYLGKNVFEYNILTSVDLQADLTYLNDYLFAGNMLTSFNFPASVTDLRWGVFSYNKFETLTIPSTIKTMYYAFPYNKLTSLTIAPGVTTIGTSSFENNNLTSVDIPSTVTNIGESAFNGNKLTSVDIPSTVTNIGESAFNGNNFPVESAIIYARNSDGTEDKTRIVSY